MSATLQAQATGAEAVASVIKAQLAESWAKDSRIQLDRIQAVAQRVFTSQGDGKLFTDHLLFIETNLKAVRICFSPISETPEDAFKSARGKGHKVMALAESIEVFRPNWVQNFLPNAMALLDRAQKYGMPERYDRSSGIEWFKPERQEFLHSFSHLATKIHTAAAREVEQCFRNAPFLPAHFRNEIEQRLSRMK